jgi:uncharacterized membrane protein YdjX (TVP38/TMEM64 family)
MIGLMASIAAGTVYLWQHGFLHPDTVNRYRSAHSLFAIVSFLLIYAISTFIALPTLPLNLASGLLWGPWWGGVLATAGATIGATAAFYSARLFLGDPARYDSRMLDWIQSQRGAQDWRWIAFLRLNPIFPTSLLNYLIGLTAIRARTYVWATFCFLLPPSFAVALIGRQLGTFSLTADVTRWVQRLSLFSAAVVTLVVLRYGARYFYLRRQNPS